MEKIEMNGNEDFEKFRIIFQNTRKMDWLSVSEDVNIIAISFSNFAEIRFRLIWLFPVIFRN